MIDIKFGVEFLYIKFSVGIEQSVAFSADFRAEANVFRFHSIKISIWFEWTLKKK